jgi:hypothetical protein
MTTFKTFFSTVGRGRPVQQNRQISQASLWAQYRFRHSMIGESGIHEAARLFGVGR